MLSGYREDRQGAMFDCIIAGGFVYDGEGNPPAMVDVAISGDSIADVGDLSGASSAKHIDASGKIVAPGFIDIHSHADLYLLSEPRSIPKLMQGVTTEVIGNCGFSLVPVRSDDLSSYRGYLGGIMGNYDLPFRDEDMAGYVRRLEENGVGVNVVPLAGHGAIRRKVMGMRAIAESRDVEEMCDLLRVALEEGAQGFSTGLVYPPACNAGREELVALCRVVKSCNGIFGIHLRNEGDYLLEALEEVFSIVRETGVSIQISHLKAYGQRNWHKADIALRIIEGEWKKGTQVSFDAYPYTYGSTTMAALLPSSLFERGGDVRAVLRNTPEKELRWIISTISKEMQGGKTDPRQSGWHQVIFAGGTSEKNRPFEGLSIGAIGEKLTMTPEEVFFRLLREEGGSASMLTPGMHEESVRAIMTHHLHIFGSDGLYGRKPHPRTYGTYARALEHYVRKKRLITLQEALRHMTSSPARKLGLKRRGSLKKGYSADLVIFDPQVLADRSSAEDPCQSPHGIEYVFVNGTVMVEKGVVTPNLGGRILRREA